MQCVILAAGNGIRMRPLTDNCPKPLVKVGDKAILDHIVQALPSFIDEIIIVTGYLGEMIKDHCGDEFYGRKITYITQSKQNGTAKALWLCRDLIRGRFLFLFADDIHGADDLERATSFSRSLLIASVDNPEKFGIVMRKPDGTLDTMVEKPKHAPSNCASTGVMVLDKHIFEFEPETEIHGEFYLTEVIERYSKKYPIAIVEQNMWIPIANINDLKRANKLLKSAVISVEM